MERGSDAFCDSALWCTGEVTSISLLDMLRLDRGVCWLRAESALESAVSCPVLETCELTFELAGECEEV